MTVFVLAFLCEYMDSTLGMGYGTTLTPVLILLGYEPLEVIPVILLSEVVTGFAAGLGHHRVGNAIFHAGSRHLRIALVLAACSIAGASLSVLLSVNLPPKALKGTIGLIIIAVGLVLLFNVNRQYKFSWRRLYVLGLVASFNKGISGGGYGPLVTGGQILSGINAKSAIAISTLSEGLASIIAVLLYLWAGPGVNWQLLPYLLGGSLLSVPLAVLTVQRLPLGYLRLYIALLTLALGSGTVGRLIVHW